MVSVDVDSRDDKEAADWAVRLNELLKNPMVLAAIEGSGIKVRRQQVHQPTRLQQVPPARR
jgi:hypothetical protein